MMTLSPPFLVAAVLAMAASRAWRRRARGQAVVFLVSLSLTAAMVGLRYAFDAPALRVAQAALAAWPGPLGYVAFAPLFGRAPLWRAHALAPSAASVLASGGWMAAGPARAAFGVGLDLLLIGLFLGYGVAFLFAWRKGVDGFSASRFSDAAGARRATGLLGATFVAFAAVDVVVAADFQAFGGAHAPAIVGATHLTLLAALAVAAIFADAARVAPAADDARNEMTAPSEEEALLAARIERLLAEEGLFRDPNLSLQRLARKAGAPARRVSQAINRRHGASVTQFVNARRIAEAERLLRETDRAVTEIMLDVGFQSKSAFNREFLRLVGDTPSGVRRSARAGISAAAPSPES
jgi:AraC-like DNA-binding protein